MKYVDILEELLQSQIDIDGYHMLSFRDCRRIAKNMKESIFSDDCVKWYGYIRKDKKYSSFYFKGTKRALHRLLYMNFVAPLKEHEYLKFTCDNKGICCNVNHLQKKNRYPKRPKVPHEGVKMKADAKLTLKFD